MVKHEEDSFSIGEILRGRVPPKGVREGGEPFGHLPPSEVPDQASSIGEIISRLGQNSLDVNRETSK